MNPVSTARVDFRQARMHTGPTMTKKFIWGGLFLGSTVGGYLPSLWGGNMLSLSGILLSFIGGLVGIWLGYRLGR